MTYGIIMMMCKISKRSKHELIDNDDKAMDNKAFVFFDNIGTKDWRSTVAFGNWILLCLNPCAMVICFEAM